MRSNLHRVLHFLQLLQWLLVLRDEIFHVVPGCAAREDILEHVQGGEMGRSFLDYVHARAHSTPVDQDLCVPEATLGAYSEDGRLALD